MAEADAEAVAALAGELGYPNEIEAIGRRIRPIGEADLLAGRGRREGQACWIYPSPSCLHRRGRLSSGNSRTSRVINCAAQGNRTVVNRGSGTLGKEDRR
jgi:hypothetical protein